MPAGPCAMEPRSPCLGGSTAAAAAEVCPVGSLALSCTTCFSCTSLLSCHGPQGTWQRCELLPARRGHAPTCVTGTGILVQSSVASEPCRCKYRVWHRPCSWGCVSRLVQAVVAFVLPLVLGVCWAVAATSFVGRRDQQASGTQVVRVCWRPLSFLGEVGLFDNGL